MPILKQNVDRKLWNRFSMAMPIQPVSGSGCGTGKTLSSLAQWAVSGEAKIALSNFLFNKLTSGATSESILPRSLRFLPTASRRSGDPRSCGR